VKHRCASNWKMLPENDSDGYHPGLRAPRAMCHCRSALQYQRVLGEESSIKAVVRDWVPRATSRIDWSPGYQGPCRVFAAPPAPRVADFVAALSGATAPR
jgi:hypothetical protein